MENTIKIVDIEQKQEFEQWCRDHPIQHFILDKLSKLFILGIMSFIVASVLYAIKLASNLWITWLMVLIILCIKFYFDKKEE